MKKISLENKTLLVTGAAGFIGAALCGRLLSDYDGITIVGVDDMNEYYDPALKRHRLERLAESAGERFIFENEDISDKDAIARLFEKYRPDIVVNLAAQAGVRYSIEAPYEYLDTNIAGFFNILECCRNYPVEHLVFASSSSVYGANSKVPYSTDDITDAPVSLYAATKKCNELLAYSYSELYGIPATGLRFFTVYGPAGRPDMAYYKFADTLTAGGTIQIYNYGNCERDFTYIDDIVEGITRVMEGAPEPDGEAGRAAYAVYNIGSGKKTNLMEFVEILEEELTRTGVLGEGFDFGAHTESVPMQQGDVEVTLADVSGLERDFGYRPGTQLRDGLRRFAEWYAGWIGQKDTIG